MKILKHLISISFLNLFIIMAVVSANPGLTPPLALPANPKPVIKLAPSLLPKPLASVPAAPPPSPPPPAANQCIIVIDGVKYDVTQFRSQHSGGNIFSCNTDMSQIFWSRHNQAILQQMQRFRI